MSFITAYCSSKIQAMGSTRLCRVESPHIPDRKPRAAASPTSVNVEVKREGWGNQQFLSEGHWLSLSLDSQQVEKDVPAEGVLFQYAFAAEIQGGFDIWARIGFERRNEHEKKEGQQFELVHYVVHYADGQELIVPIVSEVDIDDYRVEEPRALPGAQLAWTRPYEGTTYHAAVCGKQWNNPHPNIEIQSIDVLPVDIPRGSVALLAITAAAAE